MGSTACLLALAPQAVDDGCERLPLDVAHGVEVHATLAADSVDFDNVGMIEAGGGEGLVFETLQVPWVEHGGEGEDFQGHATPQRDLLGLVDDAHATAADFAEEAEVAESGSRSTGGASGTRIGIGSTGRASGTRDDSRSG
jgi:hypothetical protein